MKKVSYIELLKEAINEYDAKVMDYKGPMTEPILTFDGEGEMETNRDASSILERYYFSEKSEKLVEQDDDVGPDIEMDIDPDDDAEDPNEIVTGEEPDDIDDTMDDLEDELIEEELELEDYEPGDEDIVAKDEPLNVDDMVTQEMISLENTVIEKLIQEMEEEEGTKDDEPDTGEAGTDLADEEEVDDITEDIDLLEAELDAIEDEEEKEDYLDVDKEVASEGEGMGPIRIKAAREVEEAFRIFKEQVEEEEEDEKEDESEEEIEEDFELFEAEEEPSDDEDESEEDDESEEEIDELFNISVKK